jgi:aminoglycoside phosphotransferase (APT) family kinase protein
VKAGRDELVVRISDKAEKIHFFQKEQWAVARAKEKSVPVPEILEVGNDIIPYPYMISRRIEGDESTHHRQRLEIVKQIGHYAAIIHTIPTKGYGHLFDWSQNTLSKNDTWKAYLQCELNATERIKILTRYKMISPQTEKRMNAQLNKMSRWKQLPCLHHGDLRLKNTMVDVDGKITAIIDWENCISSIGPFWDTSIALHDLSMDAQWKFLEGYGMSSKKLSEISPAIKLFNLLNYAPSIEGIVKGKDKNQLEHYRARMQGMLDLFSI